MDCIGEKSLERVDCRTKEGQRRYIELYGLKKFRMMIKQYGDDSDILEFRSEMIFSKSILLSLFENLNERSKRLVAAFLSLSLTARNKIRISKFLLIDPKTLQKGAKELLSNHKLRKNRIRRDGGGRNTLEQKYEGFNDLLSNLVDDHVAGDPMNLRKWVRKSLCYFKIELEKMGISVSSASIRRYFKKMKISLKSNSKTLNNQKHEDRDLQFQQINRIKNGFLKSGNPVISVDAKKKEQIGLFKSNGRNWKKDAKKVLDHDFKVDSIATVIPYGIYNLQSNQGYIYCNTSSETSELAAEMIVKWWDEIGQYQYPDKNKLLILSDSGGSNGYSRWGWKCELQDKLASKFDIQITICHYPPGASKWNPIEHRLFSYISINWAGEPLESVEKMLNLIQSTTTQTGLTVEAILTERVYKTKKKYTNREKELLNIRLWPILPKWNYTLVP